MTALDELVGELQALRRAAGEPSYAEIARRIAARRELAGLSPHSARIARTTVYDVFRTGRTRLNLELVREVVQALDGDEAMVDRWLAHEPAPEPPPEQVLEPEPAAGPSGVLLLLLACVLANLAGRVLVDVLGLPAYLDMAGTAVAAIALGPWRGAAVGVTTNLLGTFSSGPDSIPFALVNAVGALVWGYGVRHGLGRTLPRFLALNALVAVACSVVAVPVLLALAGGSTGHGEDAVTATLVELSAALTVATGLANLLMSLGDKLISGFVALVVVSALPAALRRGVPLPVTEVRPGSSGIAVPTPNSRQS